MSGRTLLTATFTVTESRWYDVVAKDTDGHTVWEQVYVHTIDKVAPKEVTNLSIRKDNDGENMIVSWTDPVSANDSYDSPFKNVKITYTLNGTGAEQTAVESVNKGVQTATFAVPSGAEERNDYFLFKVSVIDELGNTSDGVTWKFYPDGIFVKPSQLASTITNLTNSEKIIVTAEEDFTQLIARTAGVAMKSVYESNDAIRIDLDLSFIVGIQEFSASNSSIYFSGATSLRSVILPKNESFTTIKISTSTYTGGAFLNCINLEKVIIPKNITSIGKYTFYNCNNLRFMKARLINGER